MSKSHSHSLVRSLSHCSLIYRCECEPRTIFCEPERDKRHAHKLAKEIDKKRFSYSQNFVQQSLKTTKYTWDICARYEVRLSINDTTLLKFRIYAWIGIRNAWNNFKSTAHFGVVSLSKNNRRVHHTPNNQPYVISTCDKISYNLILLHDICGFSIYCFSQFIVAFNFRPFHWFKLTAEVTQTHAHTSFSQPMSKTKTIFWKEISLQYFSRIVP